MTKTRSGKRVVREMQGPGFQGRAIVISVEHPNLIGVRLKGTRTKLYVTAEAVFWLAVKQKLAADKADKKKRKKGRRNER